MFYYVNNHKTCDGHGFIVRIPLAQETVTGPVMFARVVGSSWQVEGVGRLARERPTPSVASMTRQPRLTKVTCHQDCMGQEEVFKPGPSHWCLSAAPSQ